MEDKTQARTTPAYAAYKTLAKFINSLKENGTPSQIDRSMLKSMSGSDQSSIISSLKYLNFIDDQGIPSKAFHQLIDAEEKTRPALMQSVLKQAYAFLFNGSIDLAKATTKQVEDAFRAQGASGSTVVKGIAFFLAAAREAGIPISAHVKTPAPLRSSTPKPRATSNTNNNQDEVEENDEPGAGMKKIRIQLMDKPDVILSVPESFDVDDWKFLQPILTAYINRMLKETPT